MSGRQAALHVLRKLTQHRFSTQMLTVLLLMRMTRAQSLQVSQTDALYASTS